MTYHDITADLPHCFNEQGVCVYCNEDRDEVDAVFADAQHCEQRAHDEALQCDQRAHFEAV